MSGWLTWVVRLRIPSVTAAMSATPVLSPSSPSIQLMLLIIPTIQNTVKPTEKTGENRRRQVGERVVDRGSTPMPRSHAPRARST